MGVWLGNMDGWRMLVLVFPRRGEAFLMTREAQVTVDIARKTYCKLGSLMLNSTGSELCTQLQRSPPVTLRRRIQTECSPHPLSLAHPAPTIMRIQGHEPPLPESRKPPTTDAAHASPALRLENSRPIILHSSQLGRYALDPPLCCERHIGIDPEVRRSIPRGR
ncbi:hypothetical protein GQ43DRAFT_434109 [Delitschia confertaspora ATCC 74209]|uniref:Uncharacterized protein n=1 Tax=Delitschia confertaspora ATCC 74209 TaxID=1513339 RepID=A0A9P4JK64_9PLEO|nr:hypothetical protein GQ43DRAFT_434109 [Delitschia confertaspora ATCC 74209]